MSNQDNFLDLSNINITSNLLLSENDFPVLRGLTPLSLRILNASARLIQVAKGVEVLHEGDSARDLSFIRSGRVSIAKESGAQRKILAHLNKGDVYGEFGILRNKARYASVYSTEHCEIIRIDAAAVQQVLDADKQFKTQLNKILSQRILNSFFFSHPIFQTLSEDFRQQLSLSLEMRPFHRDARLFTQGEKPKGITLIISGSVEIYCFDHNKHESLVEVRRDHDVLGELATQQGKELAYSAVAATDLDTLQLDLHAMKLIKQIHTETFKRLELYINKRAQLTASRLKEQASDL